MRGNLKPYFTKMTASLHWRQQQNVNISSLTLPRPQH